MNANSPRALSYDDLALKGVRVSKPQLWRWIRAGQFPRPFKIGNSNAWLEEEINQFLIAQAAKRDQATA
jgi:predicted DNA-binding transcriptional regulator AlpA